MQWVLPDVALTIADAGQDQSSAHKATWVERKYIAQRKRRRWTIAKKTKMWFLVFAEVLYTGEKGFKAPPEAVHKASNPRIWVLVIECNGSEGKEKESDDSTGDRTERAWVGKDNEGTEMVPMIVHVMRYVISKEQKKKWGRNWHVCNVQGSPPVTSSQWTSRISWSWFQNSTPHSTSEITCPTSKIHHTASHSSQASSSPIISPCVTQLSSKYSREAVAKSKRT